MRTQASAQPRGAASRRLASAPRRRASRAATAATPPPPSSDNPLLAATKRLARTVQGGLPIVGLLSRLAAPGGGVGWDELAYPEFARALVDTDASESGSRWAEAATALAKAHGPCAQSRNVTLCLWMAAAGGGGLVASRAVILGARRLTVTQDIEIEVDRFAGARAAALEQGGSRAAKLAPRPRPSPQAAVDLAVDALATLCLGLNDGDPVDAGDASLFETLIPPALAVAAAHATAGGVGCEWGGVDGAALVRAACTSRRERAGAYAA